MQPASATLSASSAERATRRRFHRCASGVCCGATGVTICPSLRTPWAARRITSLPAAPPNIDRIAEVAAQLDVLKSMVFPDATIARPVPCVSKMTAVAEGASACRRARSASRLHEHAGSSRPGDWGCRPGSAAFACLDRAKPDVRATDAAIARRVPVGPHGRPPSRPHVWRERLWNVDEHAACPIARSRTARSASRRDWSAPARCCRWGCRGDQGARVDVALEHRAVERREHALKRRQLHVLLAVARLSPPPRPRPRRPTPETYR